MARSRAANRRVDGESRPPSVSCSVTGTSLVASAVAAGVVLLRLLKDGEALFGASNSCSGSSRRPSRPRIATYGPSASDCDGVPVFESGADVTSELADSAIGIGLCSREMRRLNATMASLTSPLLVCVAKTLRRCDDPVDRLDSGDSRLDFTVSTSDGFLEFGRKNTSCHPNPEVSLQVLLQAQTH